jgi:hypothetical protein
MIICDRVAGEVHILVHWSHFESYYVWFSFVDRVYAFDNSHWSFDHGPNVQSSQLSSFQIPYIPNPDNNSADLRVFGRKFDTEIHSRLQRWLLFNLEGARIYSECGIRDHLRKCCALFVLCFWLLDLLFAGK